MITEQFYTTNLKYMHYKDQLDALYREWTGKDVDWDGVILVNALFHAVKDYNGNIVACAILHWNDDPVWHRRWGFCENVYVLKAYRRQGIGTMLMNSLCLAAECLGCKFMKLTSRKDEGIALYRSLGWEEGLSFRTEIKDYHERVYPKCAESVVI